MPAEGLEPSSHRWQQILSLPCMPFHHAGGESFLLCRTKSRQGKPAEDKEWLNKISNML